MTAGSFLILPNLNLILLPSCHNLGHTHKHAYRLWGGILSLHVCMSGCVERTPTSQRFTPSSTSAPRIKTEDACHFKTGRPMGCEIILHFYFLYSSSFPPPSPFESWIFSFLNILTASCCILCLRAVSLSRYTFNILCDSVQFASLAPHSQ